MSHEETGKKVTRRSFLKSSAVASAAALATQAGAAGAFAAGSDKLRIGLIGCGGRGTGATVNCIDACKVLGIEGELYAMGDAFERPRGMNRRRGTERSHEWLQNRIGDNMNAPKERRFVGFDAYKKVCETDVDLIILATPPHFRPIQLREAIEAGKNVFMEKPVAVDPAGIRSVMKSSEMAEEKGLAIVAGTQRRHHDGYRAVMKRIHRGDMGEVVGGQCYWNGGFLWTSERKPDMSDIEWQIRNWYYFTWLCGDHIAEQHVHNLDVMNWALQETPEKCLAMGGRQVRKGEIHGNIFDHFCVDYTYPSGAHVMSMSRQMGGTTRRVGEHIVGTKGTSNGGNWIKGENPFNFDEDMRNPYVQEHVDLIRSIREEEPLNEGKRVAEATLTAIMGRMSAYTGLELSWNWVLNKSKLELGPKEYAWTSYEPNPVAMPGQTELI